MAFYDEIIEKEREKLAPKPTYEAKATQAPKVIGIAETIEELKKEYGPMIKEIGPTIKEIKKLAKKYKPKLEELSRKVWGTLEKVKEERERKKLESIFKEAGIPVVKPGEVKSLEELGIPVM